VTVGTRSAPVRIVPERCSRGDSASPLVWAVPCCASPTLGGFLVAQLERLPLSWERGGAGGLAVPARPSRLLDSYEGQGVTPVPGRLWRDGRQRVKSPLAPLIYLHRMYRDTTMGITSRLFSSSFGGLLRLVGWLHLIRPGTTGCGSAVRSEGRQPHH
jgi:hypothetical protein